MIIGTLEGVPVIGLKGRKHYYEVADDAYNRELRQMLIEAGAAQKGHVHDGVYLAVPGPTYETQGECIAFRDGLKADAVGMSTTPEVIVARNRGMRVAGFSCITNKIAPDGTNATNHDEVKAILKSSEVKDRLTSLVRHFFMSHTEN